MLTSIRRIDKGFRLIEILEMTIKCYDNLGRLEKSIDLYEKLINVYR